MENEQNQNQPSRKRQKKIPDQHLFDIGKLPPSAIDLEEVVLGAIMLESYVLIKVINFFKPEIFYKDAHQKIAKAILDLYQNSRPVDILTVTEQLRKNEDLESVGGPYYVTQLTSRVTSSGNTEYHLMIVNQKFLQREIIRICSNTANEAFADSTDIFDLIEKHQLALKVLDVSDFATTITNVSGTIEDIFTNMIQIESGERVNYYQMNPKVLNEKLMLSPGNIILLAGASGSGKSSIISEMVFSAHEYCSDISTQFYSMEDLPENVLAGQINKRTFLGNDKIVQRNCRMNDEEKQLVAKVSKELTKYDIEFIGKLMKINNIRSGFNKFVEKRKAKNDGKPRLFILVIDNVLALLDHQGSNKGQTAVDDYIAFTIKQIYDEHKEDSVIILAHHFGKDQIDKKNISIAYRPTEADLKGSERYSAIATQVVLTNRPGKHEDLLLEYKGHRLEKFLKRVIIAEVTKNRIIGKTGLTYFLANLDHKYFEDL